ncbi:NAD(P)-dependent oxidoreductase [Rhodococcus sp. NPDC057529]|uniref:NAD(P)-dependent oxidoreductase n=1 Tax=Rhodococcus sp. NPDC057529 TaxID=3346158 RepID=UPI00366E3EBF
MNIKRICFIGAGSMGMPMVVRLVQAGYAVQALVRSEETRATLERAGALTFRDGAAAAEGAECCVVCVFSADQLREVLLGGGVLDSLASGAVVINHTTVDMGAIVDLADEAAARGLDFVDAPVSGTPVMIEQGELTVLLGGGKDGTNAAAEIVSAYASPVVKTGASGSATQLKLINNALFAAHSQLAEEAMRIGESFGHDRATVIRVLNACSGTSGALAYLARKDAVSFEDTERYLRKDVAALMKSVETARSLGVLGKAISLGPLDLGGAS